MTGYDNGIRGTNMTDFPLSVQAYASQDFSPTGDPFRELLLDMESEVSSRGPILTDYIGSTPPYLTPAMAQWYSRFVTPKRKAALDAVENLFGHVRTQQDAGGIFLERALDEIDDHRLSQKRTVKTNHIEKNTAEYSKRDELKEEYDKAKRSFANIQANKKGRPPKLIHWWYWLLLAGVGIAEGMINFESFKSIKIMPSPAVALGSTIVIAVLLAAASHMHGTLTKQASAYLGPHRDDIDRMDAVWLFSLGTAGLLTVLGTVWYARSSYLADVITEMTIVGGVAPSWWSTIGGSLGMNFAVYVVGVILAFLCHDDDPAYPAALVHREGCAKKYRKIDDRLNGQLRREFEKIDAQAEKNKGEARGRDSSLQHLETYQTARRTYEQVAAKDAEVIGSLENYRGLLVREGLKVGLILKIPSTLQKEVIEEIDPNQYAGIHIPLKHI